MFLLKYCSVLQGIQARFDLRGLGSLRYCLGQRRADLADQVIHPREQALWLPPPGLLLAKPDGQILSLHADQMLHCLGIILPLGLAGWMKLELVQVGEISWKVKATF